MKRLLILLALVAGIPAGGLLAGLYVEKDFQQQWSDAIVENFGEKGRQALTTGVLTLERFCKDPEMTAEQACQAFDNVRLLQVASVLAIAAGLALLLLIFFGARVASANRTLLASVFGPGVKLVLLALFVLILVQGAIATYGTYVFEATAVQRVHYFIIGAIGIGALIGAFTMLKAGFAISKRASTAVVGKVVTAETEPKLWQFVQALATKLGARPPRNIVLGFDPTFYVTSADVVVYPGEHKQPNETLYLSLPLMRVLSPEELTAVVGHELGHFRGEDTKFSLRFYPIYAGTNQAIEALHAQNEDGARMLALLPALAILSFFMEQFAAAERTIGRERELEADKAGASVANGQALAAALLKVGVTVPLWQQITVAMVEALNKGKVYTNVSTMFAEFAARTITPEAFADVDQGVMSHPTDTHPPTAMRIQALGVSIDDARRAAANVKPDTSSATLLANAAALEEELTEIQHRVLLEIGAARLPDEGTPTTAPETENQQQ